MKLATQLHGPKGTFFALAIAIVVAATLLANTVLVFAWAQESRATRQRAEAVAAQAAASLSTHIRLARVHGERLASEPALRAALAAGTASPRCLSRMTALGSALDLPHGLHLVPPAGPVAPGPRRPLPRAGRSPTATAAATASPIQLRRPTAIAATTLLPPHYTPTPHLQAARPAVARPATRGIH